MNPRRLLKWWERHIAPVFPYTKITLEKVYGSEDLCVAAGKLSLMLGDFAGRTPLNLIEVAFHEAGHVVVHAALSSPSKKGPKDWRNVGLNDVQSKAEERLVQTLVYAAFDQVGVRFPASSVLTNEGNAADRDAGQDLFSVRKHPSPIPTGLPLIQEYYDAMVLVLQTFKALRPPRVSCLSPGTLRFEVTRESSSVQD